MKKIKVRIIELAKPGMDLIIVDQDNIITYQYVSHQGVGLTLNKELKND